MGRSRVVVLVNAGDAFTLLMVRHGATPWSEAGRLNGWTDVPLSDAGRRQVRGLARSLALDDGATIWSSDLERAVATARAISGGAAIRIDERLRELDFGRLEGLTWSELEPATRRALVDFDGFEAPGGESVAALSSRVDDFLADLRNGTGPHVVVTHGGVIRLLLRRGPGDRPVRPGDAVRLPLAAGRPQAG